ncbi:MAG: peptidylprolyl isomerase [Gallionella sp.]
MKLSPSLVLMFCAVSIVTLSACTPSDSSKAAATVNGVAISQSQVELLVKQSEDNGQPDSPELRAAIVEQLSMQYLISQEAIEKGIDKHPEVADQIELARQSTLANAFVQDYLTSNPVNDEQLNAEYKKIKVEMGSNEYKARHILVKTESIAKDIISKLKKNLNQFESLAKSKSEDAGSKVNGGDLGWFDPRSMVPEFSSAVENLEKGKFTVEPVKSQFGYHVILLEDIRPKMVPQLEQIKNQLKQQIQQKSLLKVLEGIKAGAKIEVHDSNVAAVSPPQEKMADENTADE